MNGKTIGGIVLMVIGGILAFMGQSKNNDMAAQMQSLFTTGSRDPGTPLLFLGAALFIVGVVVLVMGLRKRD